MLGLFSEGSWGRMLLTRAIPYRLCKSILFVEVKKAPEVGLDLVANTKKFDGRDLGLAQTINSLEEKLLHGLVLEKVDGGTAHPPSPLSCTKSLRI
jgi:hypothetical protein